MTRLLLAAFCAAALATPALADIPHHQGPVHRAVPTHRMATQHSARHCVTRHHHLVCSR